MKTRWPVPFMPRAVIALLAIVFFCSRPAAIAQVSPPKSQAEKDSPTPDQAEQEEVLEPETEPGPEQPAPGPEQKPRRRIFKRIGPQEVTPEQREEAERLKRLGAKYGTDPTAIVGRVQLSSQYQNLVQGAQAADTTARVDLPFRGNYLLRVDVPFVKWSDPNQPGTTSAQGLSDVAVTAAWRAYNTPEYALLAGVISTMPTAVNPGLGFGKYTIGPSIATARFLPKLDSLLLGLFTQQISVGGDPSRKDVDLSKLTLQVNSFWGQRTWTIVNAVWQINWEEKAKSSMTMEFEVGRNLVGRLGIYIRPGVGIWGQSLIGAYQWNIEGGIRYVFPSFMSPS